jgi:hypothetical protein
MKVFFLLILLWPGLVQAFPINARLGYAACKSCHVSPTGGGTLTEYGKSISEETSTWGYEGAGTSNFGMFPGAPHFLLGGDVRILNVQAASVQKNLLMQADVEGALLVSDQISLVASRGIYGLDLDSYLDSDIPSESRRLYALFAPQDWLSFRIGRFMAGYGLMLADHAENIRKGLGFGQGREAMGAELGLYSGFGEILLNHQPLPLRSTLRAAAYLGKASQVGLSGSAELGKHTVGGFGILGLSKDIWIMAEYDRTGPVDLVDYAWGRLGLEVFRGFHTLYGGWVTGEKSGINIGINWFPVPHFELLTLAERSGDNSLYQLMTHYYF